VRQGQSKGLGHAVLCARPLIGDAPFAVLLPDVLMDEVSCDLRKDNLAAMLKRFDETGHSQVMVEEVPEEDVSKYGVVDCNGVEGEAGKSIPMKAIVEKPERKDAPSNLAVVGRYVFNKDIWPLLEITPYGAGNEIQLTDAIALLMKKETVEAFTMTGRSHDCGDKLGYMKAFVEHGIRHKSTGAAFEQWLKEFVSK
jgi:UTP--glucose-1-phosphate uridylyltransferase